MSVKSGRWKWILAGFLFAGVVLWLPLSHLTLSIRLALAIQSLASGKAGQDLAIKEIKIRRQMGAQEREALLYFPAKSLATRAIILVPGISELGCYHPRLVNLSRSLADKGFLVITPDIQAFRQFRISAEPIDQMLFWYSQAATLKEAHNVGKTGLAGISFSGTLALMAAARPEIRDRIGFVVGIGSYHSLRHCTQGWFAAGPITMSEKYYPTRFYAKWITMLAALDMIAANRDRLFLRGVLEDLLLQKEVPPWPPT